MYIHVASARSYSSSSCITPLIIHHMALLPFLIFLPSFESIGKFQFLQAPGCPASALGSHEEHHSLLAASPCLDSQLMSHPAHHDTSPTALSRTERIDESYFKAPLTVCKTRPTTFEHTWAFFISIWRHANNEYSGVFLFYSGSQKWTEMHTFVTERVKGCFSFFLPIWTSQLRVSSPSFA